MARVLAVPDPQAFAAATEIFPLTKAVEALMAIEVPEFVVMVHPEGTVQLYEVALATAAMV